MAQSKPKAGRHPGGRPTTRTDEITDVILDCVRAGMSLRSAAHCAGLEHSTVLGWRAQSDEFATALREARALGELNLIRACVASDSRGAMFVLERSYRGRWAKREQLTVETRQAPLTEADAIAAVEAAAAAVKLALGQR